MADHHLLPAPAAASPDAELISRCGETMKLRDAMNAVVEAIRGLAFSEAKELQDDLDRATTAYCRSVEMVATLPAVSPAGVQAKAMILRVDIEDMVGIRANGEVMGDASHKLAWSLACDLTAVPDIGFGT